MRLLSTLIGSVTLVLIYATALLATRGRRQLALCAAALAGLTPQFAHHHAVITNDSLATFFGALVTWHLVRAVSERRLTTRSLQLIGLSIGLGVLTKYTILPVAAAAFIVLALLPGSSRERLRRVTTVTVASLAVCGGWLAWNTVKYGDPLAQGAMQRHHAVLVVDYRITDLVFNQWFLTRIFKSYWGMLGSMTVPLEG